MSKKLKPCPFCGSEPTMLFDRSGQFWEIVCLNPECDITVETIYGCAEEEAVKTWNRRASGKKEKP